MKQLKICIYILFALSLATFFLTFVVYAKRENEKAKRLEIEAELHVLMEERDQLADAYDGAKRDHNEARQQLQEEVRRAEELEQKLVVEKREKEALATQVTTLTKDLNSLNIEYGKVQDRYDDLIRVVKRLKKKFEEFKEGGVKPVKLPEVVVTPPRQTATPAPSAIIADGRVLVVNDVFRFIVVNKGAQDGLNPGAELEVFRDNQVIGKVSVEKLYDSLAACTILDQKESMPIQPYDFVRLM